LRLLLIIPLLALAGPARAQEIWYQRPKAQVAVGMGASLDRNAPNPRPGRPVSAFFFGVGLGDGLLGLDLRSFANGASQTQIGRLSLELVAVLRPLSRLAREGYGFRVLRTASVDVGPAVERVSLAQVSDWRTGLLLGAHADLPIGPAGVPKELRLRLGVRRLLAAQGTVSNIPVKDSTVEIYGQLAFVF
jgi:hypothetical protein